MIRLAYFFSLLVYIFSFVSYAGMYAPHTTISNTNFTRILNKKRNVVVPKQSSLVIDCSNLKKKPIILHQQSANEIRHPASLTKMMTIYLLLEAIQNKKVTFNTKFTVSRFATRQMPSKLNLKEGEKISVLDCIKALLVKSANDVAVVVAEGLCGSVTAFCKVMNNKAKSLGMRYTNYENPSGIPNKKQVTCANDIAILGLALMNKFPKYWYLFSLKTFAFKNKTYNTHCKILRWYNGSDGAKTGYICASGFNLWVTATKYNKEGKSKRLCAIVFGEHSGRERDFKAARLMDKYFKDYTIGQYAVNKCDNKSNILKKDINNQKTIGTKNNINNVRTKENNINKDIKSKQDVIMKQLGKQEDNKTNTKDTKINNNKPEESINKKSENKNNKKNNIHNISLQVQNNNHKILQNIDESINNVLNNKNTIQEHPNEEEVIYEIESFPMNDIIKSTGKSKEYFDDLYKDDVPLQIESATPIDFATAKKASNKKLKKSNRKKSDKLAESTKGNKKVKKQINTKQ